MNFGPRTATASSELFGYRVAQSIVGKPVPIIIGTNRISPVTIAVWKWVPTAVNSGGKFGGKGAGGKGGNQQQYTYTMAAIQAVCLGPIGGVQRIWQDKSLLIAQLNVGGNNATYTVVSPYTFNPTTLPLQTFNGNAGVFHIVPRTVTYNDYGSPGSVTETIYDVVAGFEVGGPITGATWTGGTATFSTAYPPQAGQTVTVTGITPSGYNVTSVTVMAVTANSFSVSIGSNPGAYTSGGAFSVASLLAGQYSVDFSTGEYTFSPFDLNIVWQIGYYYVQANPTAAGQIPIGTLAITLFTGEPGQAIWAGTVGGSTPQLGYSEIAYMANLAWQLGTSGVLPNCSYEVSGLLQYGSGLGIIDALPSDCINFLLTDFNGLFLPSGLIDGSLTSVVAAYCLGNNLFISPVLDSQRTYADWIREFLLVANSEIISSEGLLKFGCYSEQTAAGYGVTYKPNTQPQYDLDLDDFIVKSPKDPPIKWTVEAASDVANKQTIEWTDRANEYNGSTLQEEDANSVALYGANATTSISARSICLQSVAAQVLNVQIKRACYQLRKCEFTLGWKYSRLEPMDVVTVPEQYPAEFQVAVRLLSIEEDENGDLACSAEVLLYGISAPTLHPKQIANSFTPGFQGVPGSVNPPIFFEAPEELTQQVGFDLLIAVSGGAPNWGGYSVYMSSDNGASYVYQGKLTARSNMGVTSSALPYSPDPDTTDVLGVDLRESLGTLEPVSQADCDNFKSLILVDQELMAYEFVTVTGSNQYNLESSGGAKYLRRGVFGTDITPHLSGAPFTAIDGMQFSLPYQSSDVGTTKIFKFTSFNLAGQNEEDISNVTAYPYLLKGPRLPYPWSTIGTVVVPGEVLRTPTWDLQLGFAPKSDGTQDPGLIINGHAAVTQFSTATHPPTFSLSTATTGGVIAGGQTITVGVWAVDVAGAPTRMTLATINIPTGTNTNVINITGIAFYAPSTDSGWAVLTTNPNIGWSGPNAIAIGHTTSTFTGIGTPWVPVPDQDVDHYLVQSRTEAHGGVATGTIASITGTGSTCTLTFAGASFPTAGGGLTGRLLTLIARASPATAFFLMDILIASNTATTITLGVDLTVTPYFLAAGDTVMLRTQATTYTSTTIGDALFSTSGFAGYSSGLTGDAEVGNLIWIIKGTGAFQPPVPVLSNTGTVLTTATPFEITPDATSVFIVTTATVPYSMVAQSVNYPNAALVVATLPVSLVPQTYFVQVFTVDANGNTSLPQTTPFREIYSFGVQGVATLGS